MAKAKFRDYDGGERGFTGVAYDVKRNRVDLWWKGRVDKDIVDIISAARKRDVRAAIHQAERTLGTTQGAMRRLEGSPAMEEAGVELEFVWPEIDCSGLHLMIKVPLTEQLLETKEDRAARVKRIGEEISGIPIVTVQESYQDVRSILPLPRPK